MEAKKWVRTSQNHQKINNKGKHLLTLCSNLGLKIYNGRKKYKKNYQLTCKKEKGSSVIDYLLAKPQEERYIKSFRIGDDTLVSDHNPIHLEIKIKIKIIKKINHSQNEDNSQIRMDIKKKEEYKNSLEKAIKKKQTP